MAGRIKLDLRGLEEVAQMPGIHDAVDSAAEALANDARGKNIRVSGIPGDDELPIKVHTGMSTTNMRVNRALATVVIAHAAGLAVQAKHGLLTGAASSVGLSLGGDDDLLEYVTKAGTKRTATRAQVRAWTGGARG